MSFSKISVLGNLTHNPELNYTNSGTPVCTIKLANNELIHNRATGEKESRPTFFKATAWGKQAETLAQFLERGAEIYLEGKFRPEEWTDRNGKERVTFGIQVTQFNFTGGSKRDVKRDNPATAALPPTERPPRASTEFVDPDDDLPW
jgi:single-strand DNA-binding protein